MATTFGILGATSLLVDGRQVENWGRPRERALLAALLVHAGRSVSSETLIEWAWPEEARLPQHVLPTFHNYATRIRKSLQQLPSPPELQFARGYFRLEVDRLTIDYYLFRSLISSARQLSKADDAHTAVQNAMRALKLWRGVPLSDLTSAPASAWRARVIQDEWIPAHVTLLQALVELGDLDEALVRLDDIQVDHPHDVRLAALRLTVLHRLARYTDMTAYYLTTRQQLLNQVDHQAADHLRRHHSSLAGAASGPATSRQAESVALPHQLPHDIPDFVGRIDQLAALDAAATTDSGDCTSGVVILDGMAGVGKSALAVRWGHVNRRRFPDGDFYVNLAGFAAGPKIAPATVIDDFLIALGHHPAGTMNSRAKELLLSRLLGRRRVLVILDNASDTAHVQDLLPLLSNCFVILTSRQQLSTISTTTGARRVRVNPMNTADTNELLLRRLTPRRNLDLDLDHLDRIAQLCAGIPLAAILLAEHMATRPHVGVAQFADSLDQHHLVAHIGDNGDGSRTLHTVFTWSYQALPVPERRLFRLLGMHPGTDISIEAACAADGRSRRDAVRSLGWLVAAHLLDQPETVTRYALHDLLAVYAADCAQAEEPESTRRAAQLRYLSFYLGSALRANQLLYPNQIPASELPLEPQVELMTFTDAEHATRWFDRERTNLVAMVSASTAWAHHEHAWRLADAVATFFDRHGYYHDSRIVRELGAASAHSVGSAIGEASSLESLGMVHIVMGDYEAAQRCLDAALHIVEKDGHERGQAATLYQLARLALVRGDGDTAVILYERSLEIARRIDDREGLGWTHCRLGEALRLSGHSGEALLHLNEARWHAARIGDQSAHAKSLTELGSLYYDQSDHQTAAAYCEQALRIAETIPDLEITAQVCIALAEILAVQQDTETAIAYAQRAITVCHQTHSIADEARARDVLGNVYGGVDRLAEATVEWQQASALYEQVGNLRQTTLIRSKIN